MTSPPLPPNRRRRKLIVAFMVLVSLVVAWWYWPRGDARFVGKWAVTTNLYDRSELLAGRVQPSVTITLNSSGTGFNGEPPGTGHFYWTVIDDRFVSSSSDWPGLAYVELIVHRLTGRFLGVADVSVEYLVKVTPDEFVLDYMETWEGHDEEWRTELEGQPPTFFARLGK